MKNNIKCPYCDRDCVDDDYAVFQEGFDNQIEFECEHCGKSFHAEPNVVYSTYSDCKLNGDEEHDFKATESHPTVFHCEKCYQWEVREIANGMQTGKEGFDKLLELKVV